MRKPRGKAPRPTRRQLDAALQRLSVPERTDQAKPGGGSADVPSTPEPTPEEERIRRMIEAAYT